MKHNDNTPIVRELIRLGVNRYNAYRIANESKGIAARILVRLIRALLDKGIPIP